MDFNKNELINLTLSKYYETFSCTLDTADYVPDKFNDKISKYIYKNMKKAFKQIDKEDKLYLKNKAIKNKQKQKKKKQQKKLQKPKSRIKVFAQKLFSRKKKRNEIVKEQGEG